MTRKKMEIVKYCCFDDVAVPLCDVLPTTWSSTLWYAVRGIEDVGLEYTQVGVVNFYTFGGVCGLTACGVLQFCTELSLIRGKRLSV